MRAALGLAAVAAALAAVGTASARSAAGAPVITSFTPSGGAPSAVVTITGKNFASGATVTFTGADAVAATFVSTTKLTVAVPDGAATGPLTVTTTSTSSPSAKSFTVQDPPTVDNVDPMAAKVGTKVTLTGTGFVNVTGVTFNGKKAAFTVLSSTSIKATVPTGATDGPVAVAIPGADGMSADDFHVILPPKITSVSATYSAPGNEVGITGANLEDVTSVKFGTGSTTSIDVVLPDGSYIGVVVPDNSTTGKITVTSAAGSAVSKTTLTIVKPPTVTSFTPASGHSGTKVTITGTNFLGVDEVDIGGALSTFTVLSATKIAAVVGPNATNGAVRVHNPAGTADAPSNFDGSAFDLHLETDYAYDSFDPAFAFTNTSWQLVWSTCLGLLTYPDAAGQPGFLLQPDAAVGMPLVSPDGLTYTFTLQNDLAFADGNPITPTVFKDAIERSLSDGYGGYYLGDVTDIAADDDAGTLTFTLSAANPDFEERLAMPFFCVVPPDSPTTQMTAPFPSGGPYYVSDVTGDQITLSRNAHYGGSRVAYPDSVTILQNAASSTILADLGSGGADYSPSGLSAADFATLQANTPGQAAVNPTGGIRYIALNTARPAFASAGARQAFNLLIDRTALTNAYGSGSIPSDQYLTPSMPGFVDKNIYPLNGPSTTQRATAKSQLSAAGVKNTTLQLWTCLSVACDTTSQLVKTELEGLGLGITVTITKLNGSQFYTQAGTQGAAFDLLMSVGWIPNYSDPDQTLNPLLDGTTIAPTGNSDFSYWNNPAYNAKLEAAAAMPLGTKRNSTYGALENDIVKTQAPLAAFSTYVDQDGFSSRLGCRTFQPVFGMDIGAFCAN